MDYKDNSKKGLSFVIPKTKAPALKSSQYLTVSMMNIHYNIS